VVDLAEVGDGRKIPTTPKPGASAAKMRPRMAPKLKLRIAAMIARMEGMLKAAQFSLKG